MAPSPRRSSSGYVLNGHCSCNRTSPDSPRSCVWVGRRPGPLATRRPTRAGFFPPLLVPQPWPSSYHRLRRTAGGDADAGERLHGCVAGGRPVPVGPQGGGAGRLPARPPPPPVGGGGGAQLPPPTRGGRRCGVARGRRCRRRAAAWSRMVLQEATTSVFLAGRFGRQRSFLLVVVWAHRLARNTPPPRLLACGS